MELKDVLQVIECLEKTKSKKPRGNTRLAEDGELAIVILQRGWVIVGDYYQNGTACVVKNGSVIRIWGTDKGLGQLASFGPQANTKLDPVPEFKFNLYTTIGVIKCDRTKWNK